MSKIDAGAETWGLAHPEDGESGSVTRTGQYFSRMQQIAIGIVGAGRTRQGLGPFLAKWFERAGCRVAAVSGRDPDRTRAAAVAMAEQLGHPVAACADADELARGVDAVVVACPPEGHLDGLDAALRAGRACLCEKPFVPAADRDAGLRRVEAFRERGLLLAENCQWPFALAAVEELHPELLRRPPRRVTMRLSPAWPGAAMVEDSLSHVLSLVQALVPLPPDATVEDIAQSDGSAHATDNTVRFRVVGGTDDVSVELLLKCCPEQPRPAWFAIDGMRFDRRISADYAIAFATDDGRVANVQDPLDRLVYGFVTNLQATNREPFRAIADVVHLRIRLYAAIVDALGR